MHPRGCPQGTSGRRFPRARGDAPRRTSLAYTLPQIPPRSRGCTRVRRAYRFDDRDSPALAGMHPRRIAPTSAATRFPRARGDAPLAQPIVDTIAEIPPRSRGCTPSGISGSFGGSDSPALAGMHPAQSVGHSRDPGFPRARGDAPVASTPFSVSSTIPPRSRGCTLQAVMRYEQLDDSPALAGMHPDPAAHAGTADRFPRARGDAPCRPSFRACRMTIPPRSRGCTHGIVVPLRHARDSPALAGMHPRGLGDIEGRVRFPRARGDAPRRRRVPEHRREIPPRSRGCTLHDLKLFSVEADSPALAGMHPGSGPAASARTRFPRARGDAPYPDQTGTIRVRDSPALAGMHPCPPPLDVNCSGFPRARGDAPGHRYTREHIESIPPRSRGCTRVEHRDPRRGRDSPALAGMHPTEGWHPLSWHRFPRARGDAPCSLGESGSTTRIPPRSRGCTPALRERGQDRADSPALAGMHPV